MIFNDYVRSLNSQYRELVRLEEIMDDFKQILQIADNMNQKAFEFCYLRLIDHKVNGSSASNSVGLSELYREGFVEIRECLIKIDFMEYGEILSNYKTLKDESTEKEVDYILNKFKKAYQTIHEYKKSTNDEERVDGFNNCISVIREIIQTYENFKFEVTRVNELNNTLSRGYSDKGLEIQLLDSRLSKETYNEVVDPVYRIYQKLCEISNTKEEINIVRIESGSLFVKFIGNEEILNLIAKIAGSFHELCMRNYTREGKKKNIAESTELFKSQFDIIKEMKEMGLDVGEHEELAKETLGLILKETNILISSSPDIRVNDKVLSKSDEIKKLLEKDSYKMIAATEEEKE